MASHPSLRILLGGEDVSAHLEESLTFSAVDPGGFEAASFSFPRRVDARRGLGVRIECGLQTAWEGRVADTGQKLAGGQGTQVACEGYGALLKDNEMAEIYVDHDLSRWRGPGVQRRLNLIAQSYGPVDGQAVPDQAEPALATEIDGPWVATARGLSEAWYDAGPDVAIGSLYHAWKRSAATVDPADGGWLWQAFLSDDDTGGVTDSTGSLRAAGPGSGTVAATAVRRYAVLQLLYTAAGGYDNTKYGIYWTAPTVYGDHGLTKRGAATTTQGQGFYPSDIVRDVISRLAGIEAGTIEDATGYTNLQAAYRDHVAHEQIVEEQGKLMGWHWGTWENPSLLGGPPRFDFRPYPAGATCRISRADCDDLDLRERIGDLYDRVRVTWTDVAGTTHTELRTLPNPELDEAVAGGRTFPIQMGVATQASAQTFGDFTLALIARKGRAGGQAQISGDVADPAGGGRPACLIRPGLDAIRVTDLPDLPWLSGTRQDFHIPRVETTATREGISTTVELGAGADLAEVLTARLEAATARATGG